MGSCHFYIFHEKSKSCIFSVWCWLLCTLSSLVMVHSAFFILWSWRLQDSFYTMGSMRSIDFLKHEACLSLNFIKSLKLSHAMSWARTGLSHTPSYGMFWYMGMQCHILIQIKKRHHVLWWQYPKAFLLCFHLKASTLVLYTITSL